MSSASSNFGALGLYTWRFPADLAIVVMFSTGTLAITGGYIVRRAEHGRSLRQPYWRRHLHYCIGLLSGGVGVLAIAAVRRYPHLRRP